MTPGDSVRVTIGGRMHDAEVLYTRGVSVRVRLADGREKTVPVDRVRAERQRTVVEAVAEQTGEVVMGVEPRKPLTFREYVDARHAPRPVPKPKPPWRSSAYMAHVRTFTCCVSGDPAEEAHHHGPHAMGRKGPDWTCIPLTHNAHDRFHATGVFDGMSREQTDAFAVTAQVECMTEWCKARGLDYMTAVRDALARVVEGDDV